ncbi:MAG: tetratricopeptide repeat protein, partial [Deltaproteobacteria bacterium]|nr:tetratricopeptide repeat protein [Deltaproteobacteria bacterium]
GFPFAFLETQAGLLRGLSSERAAARFVHAVTPHGDWLGLLATGGPLALALALATLALAHRRSVRPEHRAALLVVGLAALGDDALALVPVSTLLGLLLPPGAGPRRAARRGRLLASLILVGAAALLLPALVRRHASQRLLRLAEAATAEPGAHRELIDRARRIDPEDGEAALASGLAWLTAREPERAIPELEFASGRLANVGTSTALGNAHLELGHVGAAIAAYQEATRLDPGSFRAHANLVEARRRAGDLAGAERALVSARQLQPHHPKLERMAEALRRDRMELESRGVLR